MVTKKSILELIDARIAKYDEQMKVIERINDERRKKNGTAHGHDLEGIALVRGGIMSEGILKELNELRTDIVNMKNKRAPSKKQRKRWMKAALIEYADELEKRAKMILGSSYKDFDKMTRLKNRAKIVRKQVASIE